MYFSASSDGDSYSKCCSLGRLVFSFSNYLTVISVCNIFCPFEFVVTIIIVVLKKCFETIKLFIEAFSYGNFIKYKNVLM